MTEHATIYVVDDDAAVRSALGLLVSSCGWHAEVYPSAEHFLDGFDREQPGCVLLDLHMPGISGADLLVLLEQLGVDIPVIVITAFPDHPLAERARRAGARAVLSKPVRDEALLDELERALDPLGC